MRQSSPFSGISGLLPVNKPAGIVSKDVSRWLVKRLGKVKLGHVGTLDPAASGVLPVLFGRATRLQDYLLDLPKTYEFDIKFGEETDTLDREGTVTRKGPWEHVTADQLQTAATDFIGEFDQTPPIYSAVKYKGKPLYDYARGGEGKADEVPLEDLKRRVRVTNFDLLSYGNGVGSFRMSCSKGTYVRSLVRDVAEKVGSCGTLSRLVRTHSSGLDIARSYGLDEIEQRLEEFGSLVVPMEQVDIGMSRWKSPSAAVTARLRAGQQVALEEGDFLIGLEQSEEQTPLAGWAKPMVLLSEQAQAFGIGSIRRQDSGRINILMKRGL